MSKVVADRINAMHSAREAFVKAESCEQLKRALRHQTRTSSQHIFQMDDKVYYKRNKDAQWKGPGIVIGVKSQTVIIQHGSVTITAHPSRVRHENEEFIRIRNSSTNEASRQSKETVTSTQKELSCVSVAIVRLVM